MTIRFRVHLIRFRKDFSVRIVTALSLRLSGEPLTDEKINPIIQERGIYDVQATGILLKWHRNRSQY